MDPVEKKLFYSPGSDLFPRHIWAAWPCLEYLDLADLDGVAAEGFRKYLRTEMTPPYGLLAVPHRFYERITQDDCSVLFQRVGERYGIGYQEISETWTGRPLIFIFYLQNGIFRQPNVLEYGEAAVKFVHVARRFGFHTWNFTRPVDESIFPCMCPSIFPCIYPSILKGLFKMRSEHPLLVMDFIHMMCTTSNLRLLLFTEVPDREHLEFLLDAANKSKFDFWGARTGLRGGLLFQIILAFLSREGYDLVTTLIRYGFSLEKMLPVQYTNSVTCSTHPVTVSASRVHPHRESTHLFLFNIAVSHLSVRNWVAKKEFCHMYRTLVLSLPHPRESLQLVRRRFSRMFPTLPVDLDWNINYYMDSPMHPISRGVGQPVALSELCVSALRERLRENFQLPQGVNGMRIPSLFKGFLTLEE